VKRDAPGRVFCLVPARSGSTRVVDKNLQVVGGRTLLERAIASALEAFGRVTVSTDSTGYADLAQRAGADVPGLRPASLAAADTPVDDVIQHVLSEWVDQDAEVLVLVQATTPFTVAGDLRSVVEVLDSHPGARCALTLAPVAATYASLMAENDSGVLHFVDAGLAQLRTQDVPCLGVPTGGAFAARIDRLRRGEPLQMAPFAPVWVDPERALDVDDAADLARARTLAGDVP
jgi:CMP-N-acetylneuraminic acid synthetase